MLLSLCLAFDSQLFALWLLCRKLQKRTPPFWCPLKRQIMGISLD